MIFSYDFLLFNFYKISIKINTIFAKKKNPHQD